MIHKAPLLTYCKAIFINNEGMDLWLKSVSFSKNINYFLLSLTATFKGIYFKAGCRHEAFQK